MSEPLSDDERAQLSARADEFHAALARGAGSDWGPFLAGLPERLRPAVLAELVIIDLIHKWEHGERPVVEDYVAKFPEFGPADRVPPQVIVEECRCRAKAGERYDTTRYRDRFPAQYPLIRSELEGIRTSTVRGAGSGTVAGSAGPTPGPSPGFASVAEQYEMVRPLGRGVFGEVWLARKKTSGIEKAIKIVTQPPDKEAGRRERRALELIKNLRHPYLLATEDFWVADHRLHIVMELADCTLRNRLDACREAGRPGVPEGELLGYLREAAEGLDFLHSRHVVHRDVKPDNILLLNGHAKVADFGLAWQQDKLMAPMKTFAGTPAYMAPEVWGKEGGPASDLYALAVTYVELRQGRPPMKSQPIEEMMFAHLDGVHDFEPFVRDDERRVLAKALARVPEQRYTSCLAFVEELAVALGVSVVPRSGVVTTPGPRVTSPAGSGKTVPDDRDEGPRGSVVAPTKPDPSARTHGGGGSGTLADPLRLAAGPTTRQPPRKPAALVMAGVLTLGLLGVLGVALWSLFGNGGGTAPNTTEPDKDGKDKKDKPDDNDKKGGPPPVTGPVLPPNAEPDPQAKVVTLADGRQVYDRVLVRVADVRVPFRLIIPTAVTRLPAPQVAPFYVMESKVWNGLYRAGGGDVRPESAANGPDAPVTFVTAQEAATFAWAAFGKEFRLPSPEEWDYAAGYYKVTDRAEVTRPGGSPRVRLAKPLPTRGPDAGTDVNEFGLVDMAGNGREFTRAIQTKPGEPKRELVGGSVTPPEPTESVILRGRNYTLPTGLTFQQIGDEQKAVTQRQFAGARSPYTSFRVVVPLPGK